MEIYEEVIKRVKTSPTSKNHYSSRSHTIVILDLIRKVDNVTSSIFITDLAGSENSVKSNTNPANVNQSRRNKIKSCKKCFQLNKNI
jgi:hypothetical protein